MHKWELGQHYFITFVDNFSKRTWKYTLRFKSDVFNVFLEWKKDGCGTNREEDQASRNK